ncbi:hypothetical protein BDQ17DRAFT_1348174 [Cyathus striatus]|nr:hypothetical protein BDQ17DRAFT_1348174 [Cyathus striatus]
MLHPTTRSLARYPRLLPRFLLRQYSSSNLSICPSCSQPLPSPVPACTILFGLPYDPNPFIVDLPTLKQRFRDAQSVCHPDAWAARDPAKQDIAQALSSRVNEAYQTLLKPLARAEYILSRNQLPVQEHDQVDDVEFMADIMEAREFIDETDDAAEVVALMEENDDKIQNTVKQLEDLIGKQDWPRVKTTAVELRYLEGIETAAKKWLDNHT